MSLSNSEKDKNVGTIFMGPSSARESKLDLIASQTERELWNKRTELEYMERIRAKASMRVQSILTDARANSEVIRESAKEWAKNLQAKTQAIHEQAEQTFAQAEHIKAEAETIHTQAWEEGYQQGQEKSRQELEEHKQQLGLATAIILQRIKEQCNHIFDDWRNDLRELTISAIETSTAYILKEEQKEIFYNLLEQAVSALEDRRRLSLHIHPDDVTVVEDLIRQAQSQLDIKSFEVKADPTLDPYSLIIESNSGKIDNSLSLRQQIVQDTLSRLTLPSLDIDYISAIEAPAQELDILPDLAAYQEENQELPSDDESLEPQADLFLEPELQEQISVEPEAQNNFETTEQIALEPELELKSEPESQLEENIEELLPVIPESTNSELVLMEQAENLTETLPTQEPTQESIHEPNA